MSGFAIVLSCGDDLGQKQQLLNRLYHMLLYTVHPGNSMVFSFLDESSVQEFVDMLTEDEVKAFFHVTQLRPREVKVVRTLDLGN